MFRKELFTNTVTMVFNAFKRIDTPKTLGRWYYIEKGINKDKKVDWTNEDHCGCCGTYKQPNKETNKKNEN